jgi:hypothetical protein
MRHLLASLLVLALGLTAQPAQAQYILVPMDETQTNHLKAYGLTYWTLEQGLTAEWLLNYRDGAFLLADRNDVRREAGLRGVSIEQASGADVARIRATIEENNMESIILEKAPQIAVYTPPDTPPWDDAVTLVAAVVPADGPPGQGAAAAGKPPVDSRQRMRWMRATAAAGSSRRTVAISRRMAARPASGKSTSTDVSEGDM